MAGAGKARHIRPRVEPILHSRFSDLAIRSTTGPGDAERFAREWASIDPARPVIVIGGDGSVHEVLNGLLEAGFQGALGVIPAGTGNDVARNLGLPSDPEAAAAALSTHRRSVDVARYHCPSRTPERVRWFLNSISLGVSARANRIALRLGRYVRSAARYPLAGGLALLGGSPDDYEIRAGERLLFRGAAWNVTLANGAGFGGGLQISPGSRPDDGALELIIIGPISRMRGLGALARLRSGTHIELPEVHRIGGLSHPVEIRAGPAAPAETDGENFTVEGSVLIELLPGRLVLL